jgi:hypothetical protein
MHDMQKIIKIVQEKLIFPALGFNVYTFNLSGFIYQVPWAEMHILPIFHTGL